MYDSNNKSYGGGGRNGGYNGGRSGGGSYSQNRQSGYSNNRSGGGSYGYGGGRQGGYNGSRSGGYDNRRPMDLTAKAMPEDYVDKAEELMRQNTSKITTTKLRALMSKITEIYNIEAYRTEDELASENVNRLQMVRVRMAYECGRYPEVKEFVEKTELLRYIKGIGRSRKKFLDYSRYMEALVAYHRCFGGRD